MNYKTLMAVAATALCGTVFADVTSANIVGYTQTDTPYLGSTAAGAFVPVTGTKNDLIDITVIGYKDAQGNGTCEGGVQAQTLDEYGGTDKIYEWYDVSYGPGDEYHGWYPLNGELPIERGDVPLELGGGLWVNVLVSNLKLQSSGQVPTAGDVETSLPNLGYVIANPTPVNVDLVDCMITGYKDAQGNGTCEGGVQAQTLDEYGGTDEIYEWYDVSYGPDDEYYGWYPLNGEINVPRNKVVMTPGRGLWIQSFDSCYNFVWPKVEVK